MSALIRQIQQFYDASSGLWEGWANTCTMAMDQMKKDRRQAQIPLKNCWAGSKPRISLMSAVGLVAVLYLAHKFNATATGITLSPVQAARATERAAVAEYNSVQSSRCSEPLADASFDLVWSLESGEHMPDKIQFMQECYRVLKPGGTLIMVTCVIDPPMRQLAL